MNINSAFPSKYLKAADLPDEGSEVVTIEAVDLAEIGREKETKIVISFTELDKALVCNKTNARTIARILSSEECDDWVSRRIALYRTEVEFGGDMYDAIRVKSVKAPAAKPVHGKVIPVVPASKKVAPPPEVDEDNIPF